MKTKSRGLYGYGDIDFQPVVCYENIGGQNVFEVGVLAYLVAEVGEIGLFGPYFLGKIYGFG